MICLDWGVATLMLPGQRSCGDQHLVCATSEGTLVAVVDGLGHGEEAAAAAGVAISVLEKNAEMNVISLVRRCHDNLRDMRGVVMSLASFNARDAVLSWIGVGNVEGVLLRGNGETDRETLLLRGGVVGGQLPPLQAAILPVVSGNTLIFATDGVHDGFAREARPNDSPQELAERILARYARGTDDALVLVARYKGGG